MKVLGYLLILPPSIVCTKTRHLLVQLHGYGERPNWPVLPQAKLVCNSVRQVVLNSIKAYERARHRIQIVIGEAHATELDISFLQAIVRIPSDL